jgi:hypothetical protein
VRELRECAGDDSCVLLTLINEQAYAPWSLQEDTALLTRLFEHGVMGAKLGERQMQQLGLSAVPALGGLFVFL